MKYIMYESNVDNLINLYLDSVFLGHKIVNTHANLMDGWNSIWVVKNRVVAEIAEDQDEDSYEKKIIVEESILYSVSSMFSLDTSEAYSIIKNYIKKRFYDSETDLVVDFDDMDVNQKDYENWINDAQQN